MNLTDLFLFYLAIGALIDFFLLIEFKKRIGSLFLFFLLMPIIWLPLFFSFDILKNLKEVR